VTHDASTYSYPRRGVQTTAADRAPSVRFSALEPPFE
jgi:hypothetical protein